HAYYQYVRIHGDTLTMRTYDAATQQLYDDVSIVKGEHDRPTILDRAAGIAEQLDFTPQPGNKKDAAFAQRIKAYQQQKRAKK
ncbi:MAG: serine/threonine protein phosphatase, partial [Bacteroidaceae bacterium]|nr:serine/threonine protein phosphatase [Bacteroidaceae bacterium]